MYETLFITYFQKCNYLYKNLNNSIIVNIKSYKLVIISNDLILHIVLKFITNKIFMLKDIL